MSVISARRRACLVTTVLLTCALATSSAASCGDGTPTPAPSTPRASAQPTAPVRAVEAPGGGGLKVLESGFSMTTSSLNETMVTYGLVLENTSPDRIAAEAEVLITLLDAKGQPVKDLLDKSTLSVRKLRVVTPRQRIGMGRYTYVDRGQVVARLKIEIGESWWISTINKRIASLTTSDIRTAVDKSDHAVRIKFTVDNGYPTVIDRIAMAVLRNSTGAIVGGTAHEETVESLGKFPPGRSPGEIESVGGPPPDLDPNRTEVYAYPTAHQVGLI